MKRIFCILIALLILTATAVSAETFVPVYEKDYSFAGDRYSVSELDTNGKIFVGVMAGKIAYSEDFETWTVLKELDNVATVYYLKGNFCAVGNGFTYISSDGKSWEKKGNNLARAPWTDKSAKLNGSVVLFNGDATYQTYDGINFKEVKDVPPGVTVYVVNNKFFMESTTYMRGIYHSDNGESFVKTEVPGYTDSHSHLNIRYYDGMYHIQDYWRKVEDEKYNYHYYSKDLVTWQEELVIRDEDKSPMGSNYIYIGDELHAFNGNGVDMVYKNGNWEYGQYQMNEDFSSIPPWVYYIITDSGIVAWSTSHNCYYLGFDKTFRMYKGKDRKWSNLFVSNGKYYISTATDKLYTYDYEKGWLPATKEGNLDVNYSKASNGSVNLETEFIERGSWAGYEGNKEITGTLTDEKGNIKKVAYENAKYDTVSLIGGNGYFIMHGFSTGGFYISKDGINRYRYNKEISFENLRTTPVSDGKTFMYKDADGVIYKGDMSQFESINIPDTIKVCLDDEYLSYDVAPVLESDRTLVSVRFLFERAGATVEWDETENSCTLTYNGKTVKVYIDNKMALVNGEEKELDVPARLINDKTMLPLRFICEEFGFNVTYDEVTDTAFIKTKK